MSSPFRAAIWFHCKQVTHCGLGMVGSINAPSSGQYTFQAFQAAAKAIGSNEKTVCFPSSFRISSLSKWHVGDRQWTSHWRSRRHRYGRARQHSVRGCLFRLELVIVWFEFRCLRPRGIDRRGCPRSRVWRDGPRPSCLITVTTVDLRNLPMLSRIHRTS